MGRRPTKMKNHRSSIRREQPSNEEPNRISQWSEKQSNKRNQLGATTIETKD
jgi:hypothetical protein